MQHEGAEDDAPFSNLWAAVEDGRCESAAQRPIACSFDAQMAGSTYRTVPSCNVGADHDIELESLHSRYCGGRSDGHRTGVACVGSGGFDFPSASSHRLSEQYFMPDGGRNGHTRDARESVVPAWELPKTFRRTCR